MKTDSYKKLLEENHKRKQVHWRIVNSKQMFNYNGRWYDEQFFNQMFPKWEYCKYLTKGDNPDKKAI